MDRTEDNLAHNAGNGAERTTEEQLAQDGFVYQRLGPESLDADAWDDSLLIKVWEQATSQYEKAHASPGQRSSAPRAEKRKREHNWSVGDLCEAKWKQDNKWYKAKIASVRDDSVTVLFVDYDEQQSVLLNAVRPTSHEAKKKAPATDSRKAAPLPSQPRVSPPAPPPLPEGDDDMSNLLMAWYYAGYYTGFHQGRKRRVSGADNETE